MPIDDNPGVWLLLPKNEIERPAHMLENYPPPNLIAVRRHEPAATCSRIALLKRQIDRTSKQLHHLGDSGCRASRFPEEHRCPGRALASLPFDLG